MPQFNHLSTCIVLTIRAKTCTVWCVHRTTSKLAIVLLHLIVFCANPLRILVQENGITDSVQVLTHSQRHFMYKCSYFTPLSINQKFRKYRLGIQIYFCKFTEGSGPVLMFREKPVNKLICTHHFIALVCYICRGNHYLSTSHSIHSQNGVVIPRQQILSSSTNKNRQK